MKHKKKSAGELTTEEIANRVFPKRAKQALKRAAEPKKRKR